MPIDSDLAFARARAYRSKDPFWWSNLGAAYATLERPNLKRARHWYQRAARKGHDRGLFEYGLMLILGEGGPRRPAQGRRLVERAAALGEIDALRVLVHAYADGTYSFRRSPARARRTRVDLRKAQAALSAQVKEHG